MAAGKINPISMVFVGALIAAPMAAQATPPCERIELTAQIENDLRAVHGTITCIHPSTKHVWILDYTQALSQEYAALDDIDLPRVYWSATAPETMQSGELPTARNIATPVIIEGTSHTIAFRTALPERMGILGFDQDAAYLMAGWHPLFANYTHELGNTPINYAITLPDQTIAVIGNMPVGRNAPRHLHGTIFGPWMSMVVARQANVKRLTDHAVLFQAIHETCDPDGLHDLRLTPNTSQQDKIQSALKSMDQWLHPMGLHAPSTPIILLTMDEQLAVALPSMIAVSDRAFRVFGSWFQDMHHGALARQVFLRVAMNRVSQHQERWNTQWIAEAMAEAMLQSYMAQDDDTQKKLGSIAYIPELDLLVNDHRTPLKDAHYHDLYRAHDPTHPHVFHTNMAPGRWLYENLKTEWGAEKTWALALEYLQGNAPLESVVVKYDRNMLARMDAWLTPPKNIEFALGEILEEQGRTTVAILGEGDEPTIAKTPVTVEVQDNQGGIHREKRLGPGTVVFDNLPSPAARVEIDPEHRIVENARPMGASGRHNNTWPKPWKWMLNDFSGLFAATEKSFNFDAKILLRPVRDARISFAIAGASNTQAYTADIGVRYAFGPEVGPMRPMQHVNLELGYYHLKQTLADDPHGDLLEAKLKYVFDNRRSWYYGMRGAALRTEASGFFGVAGDQRYLGFRGGIAGLKLWQLGTPWLALAVRLRADGLFGNLPIQLTLPLGGRFTGARGFETREGHASWRGIASMELRHVIDARSRVDLAGWILGTRIEGALFADALVVDSNATPCGNNMFYDVGYGLRFMGDIFHLAPATLNVDVGVPFGRCQETHKIPVTVYVSFVQSFMVF